MTDMNTSPVLLSSRILEEEEENEAEEEECDTTIPSVAPRRQRKPRVTPRSRTASKDREMVPEAPPQGSDPKLAETPSEPDHSFGEVRRLALLEAVLGQSVENHQRERDGSC